MPEDEPTVDLTLWRTFGMTEVMPGRPDEWVTSHAAGPQAGDEVALALGRVPNKLLQAVTEWGAQTPSRLGARSDHRINRQQSQERYEASYAEADTPHFDEPYPMALTVSLKRRLTAPPLLADDLHWAEESPWLMKALGRFEETGNTYLDAVIPYLITPMWPMNFGRLLYGERRAFCTSPGRPAFMTPRFTLSVADWGAQVTRVGGWSALPTGELAAALADLPSGRRAGPLTAAPAGCFLLAAAEQDPVRQFVFAFAGLDMLANAVASKRRERLVTALERLDEQLPATQLLSPEAGRDRGLPFKIAAMVYLYSPNSTGDDIAEATRLTTLRNELFHSSRADEDFRDASITCKEFLRRYLGLVAAREGA